MKKMILAACFISVVITLADSVKPGDKFSSQLKLIFSLVFICGILTAALNGQYESGFDLSFDTDNIETYDSISGAAESSVISSAESSIADTVRNVLDENGVSYEKITASINIEEDSRININEIGYKGDEPERAAEVIRENIGDTEVRNIE
ncbi:MAG: hypothetical protein HFK00_07715 [Oscillospiraceae bacterium]|jgi:hypothetical protein|nr:hypothetical protein [Oscillospiraceae bacterium]